jgi:hypothetical protein
LAAYFPRSSDGFVFTQKIGNIAILMLWYLKQFQKTGRRNSEILKSRATVLGVALFAGCVWTIDVPTISTTSSSSTTSTSIDGTTTTLYTESEPNNDASTPDLLTLGQRCYANFESGDSTRLLLLSR